MATPAGPTGPTMEQMMSTMRGFTGTNKPYVPLTPEQVLANIKAAEDADLKLLTVFKTPNMATLNASMTAWTTAGSRPVYVILSITLSPPSKCSDGVMRGLYDYISWLIKADVSYQTKTISALFPGKDISYSVSGNVLKLHVSKE